MIDIKVTMGFIAGALVVWLYMQYCNKKMGA